MATFQDIERDLIAGVAKWMLARVQSENRRANTVHAGDPIVAAAYEHMETQAVRRGVSRDDVTTTFDDLVGELHTLAGVGQKKAAQAAAEKTAADKLAEERAKKAADDKAEADRRAAAGKAAEAQQAEVRRREAEQKAETERRAAQASQQTQHPATDARPGA